MTRNYFWLVLCIAVELKTLCEGQYFKFKNNYVTSSTASPLPFPACRADNLDCLRRGLRTFFFMMNSGYLGMAVIDPVVVNSVSVSLPDQQLSVLLRRANVTGAKWTRLAQRKFNLVGDRSGVKFNSDLHVTGEIHINMAARMEPYVGFLTMDIHDVESNITYGMSGQRGVDNEDYILIGPERIAVRNTRTPTFFAQPDTEDTLMVEQLLSNNPSILEYLSNEIVTAVMHSIVDNFRLFACKIPVKYYYEYF